MEAFTRITGIAAPLEIAKIDTGMIVPGRFQRIRRRPGQRDYADVFLHDLRFDEPGSLHPDFVLNHTAYRNAVILVTGPDFGCGSSRESAAYAVLDFGVRALIGPSFGDVFVGNCMQNGVLPVVLPLAVIQRLWSELAAEPGASMSVDLVDRKVTAPDGTSYEFSVDETRRERMLKGLDDVGVTLEHLPRIEAFEREYHGRRPWLPQKR